MNGLISAIEFLTIIPVKSKNFSLKNSVVYFPLVGIITGSILVGVNMAAVLVFPRMVADAFTLIALVILTGALHLDGFADTIDGIFGGKDRDDTLRIMADEHIGTFAVVGVFSLLLLKFTLIYGMQESLLYQVLVLMPTLGKYSMVLAIIKGRSAKSDGLGSSFISSAGNVSLIIAGMITLGCCVFFLGVNGLIIYLIVTALTLVLMMISNRMIGGLTGDTIGAINEIVELCVLMVVFVLVR